MEFFKRASGENKHHLLIGHITHIFNRVLRGGYPKAWSVSTIVPVPKPKGDSDNMDDYRGITVGVSLSKLYSLVLLRRMDEWAEKNGFRARGQAGFRYGKGTSDNAFVLNHIIEKYKIKKKAVYSAFIDFRKAYDSIDRSNLWKALRSFGVGGDILDTLIAMYTDVRMRVRLGGEMGTEFESAQGVKQGDPLSPLLFGLFIDRFEKVLAENLPDLGVELRSVCLKLLLYADDLVLLAESKHDLQRLLCALEDFCSTNGLTVNVKKSEAVTFNRHECADHEPALTYLDKELVVKSEFSYLGMQFHETSGMKVAWERGLEKGRKAYFAMMRRLYELKLNNIHLRSFLFDALVRPILAYGSEIWGPVAMQGAQSTAASVAVEKLHMSFLGQSLGVRQQTSVAILMNELDRTPINLFWLRQILRFWNKICARGDTDLVYMAMCESCELARAGSKKVWAAHVIKILGRLGFHNIVTQYTQPFPFITNIETVLSRAEEVWRDSIRGICIEPTTITVPSVKHSIVHAVPDCEHRGFRWLTYSLWFSPHNEDKVSRFYSYSYSYSYS